MSVDPIFRSYSTGGSQSRCSTIVHSLILAAREAQIIPGDVIAMLSAAMTTNRAQTDLRGTQEVPEETFQCL
jgi:hypothetical protein